MGKNQVSLDQRRGLDGPRMVRKILEYLPPLLWIIIAWDTFRSQSGWMAGTFRYSRTMSTISEQLEEARGRSDGAESTVLKKSVQRG